jgi:serine/threonine-protein kinase
VAPGVPDSFDAWWAKAAQRDPNRRFQSAKELVESLGVSLGVSMPTHLGQTPMPGSPTGHRPMAHSAPDIPLDATAAMVGPSPGELPFAAVGSQPSHPGRTGLGPQPYSPMGGAPVGMAPHSMGSAGMSSGVQPMPGMGDSNAYPTVGGVAAPSNPRSSTMVAVIGAVLALVIAGGFGVFFATMRNADDAANAADGEDATSASAVVDDEPPPATSDDAEPSASDDSASSEVEQDTAPDAGASATPSARPTPAPRGRRSRPPKPAGTFDPGF